MKAVLLAVAAACLAAQGHTLDVKTVGDENSGIFTKIISDAPAGAPDAGVYSTDDTVDPIFYDAQGRSQSIRRRQQGSYLDQPNRYQIGNRFSASNQIPIGNRDWQKTQAGIKYDNFGRPIRTAVGRPSNIYQDRITAGQGGNILANQLSQGSSVFSQGNRVVGRPSAFDQYRESNIPFGSTFGQRNQASIAGQRLDQQIGLSRPGIGQQFANQFGSQQTFQQGQLQASGQRLSSQQQFGQQFGRPSIGQFSQIGQQSAGQFGQQSFSPFNQPQQSLTGQSGLLPFNQRQVQRVNQNNVPGLQSNLVGQQGGFAGQQFGGQFGGQSSGQFGQHSGLQFGQQIGSQFGQQASGQFGQQAGLQFGQQQGNKFGQQSTNLSGQRIIGQQSGFQPGIRSDVNQFNQIRNQQTSGLIGNPLRGNEIGSQQISGNFG